MQCIPAAQPFGQPASVINPSFIDPFPAPRPERDPLTGAVKPLPPEPVG